MVVPNSVTAIEEGAFYGCNNMSSITIPNTVKSIGPSAFYECYSLASITIPDSLAVISDFTYYGCRGLTTVTIPRGVTSIGTFAFIGCDNLKDLYSCITTPYPITQSAFSSYETTTLYVPNGTKSLYQETWYWNHFNKIEEFDPTEIKTLHADDTVEMMRYNANGMRVNSPQKGLNLKRMSDGTIRKVMVK